MSRRRTPDFYNILRLYVPGPDVEATIGKGGNIPYNKLCLHMKAESLVISRRFTSRAIGRLTLRRQRRFDVVLPCPICLSVSGCS